MKNSVTKIFNRDENAMTLLFGILPISALTKKIKQLGIIELYKRKIFQFHHQLINIA